MSPTILHALFADAWHQVLDNRVFRAVAVLVLLPTAAAFLVGFREEELVLLFGWKHYSYESLFNSFNISASTLSDGRAFLIETVVDRAVGFLTGTLGIFVALAATAFFVPRMLERGAADVMFHKPVPRLLFFLSRYAAGLVFVGLLTTALALGVFAGLRVVSHYTYFGLFWAIPVVLYVYSVFHAVSMLIGVWSRSTSASLLLTFTFLVGNGCVHTAWSFADAASEESRQEEPLRTLTGVLHAAHLVLPKTADAQPIVDGLRRAGERAEASPARVNGNPLARRELAWDADLARSIPFSLASTIAFTLGVLFLGWRRLERIDF